MLDLFCVMLTVLKCDMWYVLCKSVICKCGQWPSQAIEQEHSLYKPSTHNITAVVLVVCQPNNLSFIEFETWPLFYCLLIPV